MAPRASGKGEGNEPASVTPTDTNIDPGTPPEGTVALGEVPAAVNLDAPLPPAPDAELDVKRGPGVTSLPHDLGPVDSECEWPNVELRFNARGDEVRTLQELLLARDLYKGRLDGWYGMKTVAAVSRAQRLALAHGVLRGATVDGQWSAATRAAVCRLTSMPAGFDVT